MLVFSGLAALLVAGCLRPPPSAEGAKAQGPNVTPRRQDQNGTMATHRPLLAAVDVGQHYGNDGA
jgi:hypothetical protein